VAKKAFHNTLSIIIREEEQIMENKILQTFLEVMPVLKDILDDDIGVAVANTTNILAYRPGDTINLKHKVGDQLLIEEPLYKTIKNGKRYSSIAPREIHGVPFKSITYPIKDSQGIVIGAIGISKSLKNHFEVEEASESLSVSLQQTSASVEEICDGSQKLFAMIENIVESAQKAEKQINESYEILNLIQNVARQSNLLGLNAAIESSRAGELGRGFSVVASEMRKLAKLTGESSEKVSKTLIEMNNYIEDIKKVVNQVHSVSQNQVAETEEITAVLEKITLDSQRLVDSAKIV
jgi:methyl-accepting chemotaxis protein